MYHLILYFSFWSMISLRIFYFFNSYFISPFLFTYQHSLRLQSLLSLVLFLLYRPTCQTLCFFFYLLSYRVFLVVSTIQDNWIYVSIWFSIPCLLMLFSWHMCCLWTLIFSRTSWPFFCAISFSYSRLCCWSTLITFFSQFRLCNWNVLFNFEFCMRKTCWPFRRWLS